MRINVTSVWVDDQAEALTFAHPAAEPFKNALTEDGIPFTSFTVDEVHAEYERLQGLGVRFTQAPVDHGPVTTAVLDDTCGTLVQIAEHKA